MAATEQVTLNVDGMTCAGCQAHVQEALAGKAGVTEASVNLLMKRAAVTFDPSVISPEALVEAVRESGYEASLPDSSVDAIAEQEARDRAQEAEYRSLRLKAIASCALLVISLAVMGWAGRHFYVRAWASVKRLAADMNTLVAVSTIAALLYSL